MKSHMNAVIAELAIKEMLYSVKLKCHLFQPWNKLQSQSNTVLNAELGQQTENTAKAGELRSSYSHCTVSPSKVLMILLIIKYIIYSLAGQSQATGVQCERNNLLKRL